MGIVSEQAVDEFQELIDKGLTFSSHLFLFLLGFAYT